MKNNVNPFAITRADFLELLGSPLMGRRVLYAADHGVAPWCELLKTVRPGGRGCERLLDYASTQACYEEIRSGHTPPMMPSEIKHAVERLTAKIKPPSHDASRSRKRAKSDVSGALFPASPPVVPAAQQNQTKEPA
jgi:hypothetical protein